MDKKEYFLYVKGKEVKVNEEISKGSVWWSSVIHEIHEPDINFAVVFQFSQRAVTAGHKSEKYCF